MNENQGSIVATLFIIAFAATVAYKLHLRNRTGARVTPAGGIANRISKRQPQGTTANLALNDPRFSTPPQPGEPTTAALIRAQPIPV